MNALVAALLACFLALSHPVSATEDEALAEILSQRWIAAYDSGDSKTLGAMYSTDARLLHGSCFAIDGRQAIEGFWREDLEIGPGKLSTRLQVIDAVTKDDLTFINGSYTVNEIGASGDTEVGRGEYAQVWRRQAEDHWAIYREAWLNLACSDRAEPPGPDGTKTELSI